MLFFISRIRTISCEQYNYHEHNQSVMPWTHEHYHTQRDRRFGIIFFECYYFCRLIGPLQADRPVSLSDRLAVPMLDMLVKYDPLLVRRFDVRIRNTLLNGHVGIMGRQSGVVVHMCATVVPHIRVHMCVSVCPALCSPHVGEDNIYDKYGVSLIFALPPPPRQRAEAAAEPNIFDGGTHAVSPEIGVQIMLLARGFTWSVSHCLQSGESHVGRIRWEIVEKFS